MKKNSTKEKAIPLKLKHYIQKGGGGGLIESGALKINSVGSLLENASTQDMNKCKKPVNFNGYS